jgi:hypothetical protein
VRRGSSSALTIRGVYEEATRRAECAGENENAVAERRTRYHRLISNTTAEFAVFPPAFYRGLHQRTTEEARRLDGRTTLPTLTRTCSKPWSPVKLFREELRRARGDADS